MAQLIVSDVKGEIDDLVRYIRETRPLHPRGFVDCIEYIHQMDDKDARNVIMGHVEMTMRLGGFRSEAWVVLWEAGLHRLLMDIVLEGDLCGASKEAFLGPRNSVRRPCSSVLYCRSSLIHNFSYSFTPMRNFGILQAA